MLGERLTNASSDCTSLPREGNGSCVSCEEIESEYDGMERAEDGDREREDRDREGEDGGREGYGGGHVNPTLYLQVW